MAGGFHLFPFRTQKLSLLAPMVLPGFPVGESVVAGMMQRCTHQTPQGPQSPRPRRGRGWRTGRGPRAQGHGRPERKYRKARCDMPTWGDIPAVALDARDGLGYFFNTRKQARSSVGEHYLDMVGVDGSIPPAPTSAIFKNRGSNVSRTSNVTEANARTLHVSTGRSWRSGCGSSIRKMSSWAS